MPNNDPVTCCQCGKAEGIEHDVDEDVALAAVARCWMVVSNYQDIPDRLCCPSCTSDNLHEDMNTARQAYREHADRMEGIAAGKVNQETASPMWARRECRNTTGGKRHENSD